ncbi:hypothetical protein JNK13_10970 [bacterium]|nr:hypothetical protein [bacterium]
MLLIFKIILVPAMIALVSFAGRLWGHYIGGFLVGLPLIVGPILIFLAIDHGNEFAATSAKGALAGVISIGFFCFLYAITSQRFGIFSSLCAGLLGFAASTSLFSFLDLPLFITFLLVILLLCIFLFAFPQSDKIVKKPQTSFLEILIRMIAAATLVLLITYSSDILGPRLSGLLAPFPIAGTILSGFTHYSSGDEAARQLLNAFIKGLFGMAVFCFILALTLSSLGILLTLLIAIPLTFIGGSITKHYCPERLPKAYSDAL